MHLVLPTLTLSGAYDPKCFDLASAFLSDVPNATEAMKDSLAQEIQRTIEGFLEDIGEE